MSRHILPRPADTAEDAERVQVDLLRAASVARRIHTALALTTFVTGAARRRLAYLDPQASSLELDLRFVSLHYGAAVADDVRAELDRRDRKPSPGA